MIFNHVRNVCHERNVYHEQNVFRGDHHHQYYLVLRHHCSLIDHEQNVLNEL